jgi:FAD/FMN-containing dehydrogenase
VSTRRAFLAATATLAAAPAHVLDACAAAAPGKRAFAALRHDLRGTVLLPGHAAYESARKVYDTRWDAIRPPAVVRPRDAGDVQTVVRWAGDHDVALVARSGGHGYNGGSTSETAVVVDLRHLNAIRPGAIAVVGPAARNIDVYAALAGQGRGWASGSCPTVAAGGLALGGGMGLAARRHGLTLDTLTAAEIVTADGRRQTVSGDDDLFWAIRGGGGNFGIVTALHLETFTRARAASFQASYPRSSADAALAAWDALAPTAPRELTSIFTLPRGSGARVTALGQFLGTEAALRRIVAPLANVAGVTISYGTSDYLSLQRRWAGCADGGLATCQAYRPQSFAAASVYVADPLTAADRHAFLDAAEDATLLLDAYGGAINDVAAGATAFVHRDARFSVQILDYGAISSVAPAVARAHAKLQPISNGEAYQNYADPALANARQAWYGANLPRLRQIKGQVDPDRRFRLRQGI